MRRSAVTLIASLTSIAAVAAGGCGRHRDDAVTVANGALSATTARITVPLPAGAGFAAVPVAATDQLRVDDRARVQLASGVASGAVANSGSASTSLTNIGVESRTGTITSAAPVTLRDRAQITGDVTSAGAITPGSNVVVSGTQTQNTPLTFDRWSWPVSLPASGGPVSVPVNGSRSIGPGSYSGVTAFSGATLSLRNGTYFMDSLDMEPSSRLAVDTRSGNIIVYLRTGLIFRGTTVFTGPNDRLLVVYLGSASPALDRSFDGTLVAQSASVRLGVGGSPYVGAVYAKSIEIDPDVRFTARTYAGWGAMPFFVEPRFNCLERRPGGAFVGNFGYRNPGAATVNIAVGADNQFSPGLANRQQPTTFLPGTHDNQFAVIWVTHPASWFVNGIEAPIDTAKVCPASTPFAANADTTVKSSAEHANFGAATTLSVGAGQQVLVSFDRAAIASFLGANRLVGAAHLELTLSGAAPATPVEVIPMRKGWTEAGATWTCGNDTDASAAGETCDIAARWNMVRRDGAWQNPWYRVPAGASNVGVVAGGKLSFDVTAQTQEFLGTERTANAVSFILQAVGGTGLSGQLASREAGATSAPRLVIEPITFTDYDVVTTDDLHAPFSFTVDTSVVPSHPSLPPLVAGGADRTTAAVRAADGTQAEFTDSELLVFTDSASELAAIQARLGATLLYQSSFTVPGMPRANLIHINPAVVSTANMVPGLIAKVPGLRGRQRASSDAAIRLFAAAFDEVGRGSKVALNWLMKPGDLPIEQLATSFVFDGNSSFTDPLICTNNTAGICSNNDFDWAYFKPAVHNVPQAWKAYSYTGHFLDNIEVAILDAGFRREKLDGNLGDLPTPGCPSATCTSTESCGGDQYCRYHGTAVANAGFGEPGNAYGAAGPGWPSIGNNLSLAYSDYDPFTYIISGFGSIFSGTDILNMSFGGYIPDWAYALGAGPFLETQTEQFRLTGILQFAAAGNDGIDVDKRRCYHIKEPITDAIAGVFGAETPLQVTVCPWEESFTWPCESWGVDCVEGSNFTDRGLDRGSNFGSNGGTQYRASYSALMGGIDETDDSRFYLKKGTSFSTPLTVGVADMTWMANPALSSWDVEDCLSRAGGFIDAFASVKCAFGSPSNFAPIVQITSPADQKEIPPPAIGGVPTSVLLSAWADDVEDGKIDAIDWKVNGAPVGTTVSGGNMFWPIPGPGTFVAEAHVTDSGGQQFTARVTFYVSPSTPDVVIVSPPRVGATPGSRFAAIAGLPIDLFAQVPNRILAPCESIKWTAVQGTTPVFTDKVGCSLEEAFTAPTLPGTVTLTASFTEPTGSDTDTVTIDVIDDGKAHVQITNPKIDLDKVIHVQVNRPITLTAASVRIPDGNPFTWTYQTGSNPLTPIGSQTASNTVTFAIPVHNCGFVPGTINVTAFDAGGVPATDQIQVSFEDSINCEPH